MPGRPNNHVVFATSDKFCRPARDDEYSVMEAFSSHASRCSACADPYRVYIQGGTLCDRGHIYARDVAQYVFTKAGKAYSKMDRERNDSTVQIEIPAGCDAVRSLLKAVDRGFRARAQRPVVSHDPTYPVSDRRPTERRAGYDVVEAAPRRREDRRREGGRRETVYVPGRGSLYHLDEQERQRRYEREGNVQIVIAEPRRRAR